MLAKQDTKRLVAGLPKTVRMRLRHHGARIRNTQWWFVVTTNVSVLAGVIGFVAYKVWADKPLIALTVELGLLMLILALLVTMELLLPKLRMLQIVKGCVHEGEVEAILDELDEEASVEDDPIAEVRDMPWNVRFEVEAKARRMAWRESGVWGRLVGAIGGVAFIWMVLFVLVRLRLVPVDWIAVCTLSGAFLSMSAGFNMLFGFGKARHRAIRRNLRRLLIAGEV